MLVDCRTHGVQQGILVSPDVCPASTQLEQQPIVSVLFEHEGEIAIAFYVSRAFAVLYCLSDDAKPVPDQLGGWAKMLQSSCKLCFQEAHGGIFGNDHRWKAAI